MTPELIEAAAKLGPFGLLLAFMAWKEKTALADRKEQTEANKALAASLASLTIMIQQLFARDK